MKIEVNIGEVGAVLAAGGDVGRELRDAGSAAVRTARSAVGGRGRILGRRGRSSSSSATDAEAGAVLTADAGRDKEGCAGGGVGWRRGFPAGAAVTARGQRSWSCGGEGTLAQGQERHGGFWVGAVGAALVPSIGKLIFPLFFSIAQLEWQFYRKYKQRKGQRCLPIRVSREKLGKLLRNWSRPVSRYVQDVDFTVGKSSPKTDLIFWASAVWDL
jgi:hypothetical protein